MSADADRVATWKVAQRTVAWMLLLLAASFHAVADASRWRVEMPVSAFERAWFVDRDAERSVVSTGSLRGAGEGAGSIGWAEYSVEVPGAGWYVLGARGPVTDVSFEVTPASSDVGVVFHATQEGRIGNAWLNAGRHTVRISKRVWWGFGDLRTVSLQASDGSLVQSMRAQRPDDHGTYRLGACPAIPIWASPSRPTTLTVFLRELEQVDGTGVRSAVPGTAAQRTTLARIEIVPGNVPARYEVPLPCDREGVFKVSFGESGREFDPAHLAPLEYEVIDTRSVRDRTSRPEPSVTGGGVEFVTIDAAEREPDFQSPGGTRIRANPAGPYRETVSDKGFQPWQRQPAAVRSRVPEPTAWFAYRIDGLTAQRPYRLEVDYPDDALRTFTISIRDRLPLEYPVTGGVDTGGEFVNRGGFGTHVLLFWPRSDSIRVVFANVHDGRRPGVARVRLIRLDQTGDPDPQPAGALRKRQFASWYEEGLNFASMFGAPSDRGRVAMRVAAERWARSVRAIGGSVLMPTVSVYHFHLYPSRFVTATSKPTTDDLRRIVLFAEKHGLDVLPELHVRGDDLARPDPDLRPLPERVLGSRRAGASDPGLGRRLFSPAHPDNERWFRGVVRELADRYRDSAALQGVSIRLMEHQNPGLTNFGGGDWGFDDDTLRRFVRSTGVALAAEPSLERGTVADVDARRRTMLRALAEEHRDEWRRWRERVTAGVFARLRDEVRASRGDLTLFVNVQGRQRDADTVSGWREAGVDLRILARLGGVQLLDGTARYGRDSIEAGEAAVQRFRLADTRTVHSVMPGGSGHHLASAQYVESTESVIPPTALGDPRDTRATWASAVVEPPGRYAVARFATQLAQTDAVWLGDGGNGYLLGQPALWDFLSVYRRLPAEAFDTLLDRDDALVVRQLTRPEGTWVYAVNASGKARRIRITSDEGTGAVDLRSGERLPPAPGGWVVDLHAYGLAGFRLGAGGPSRSSRSGISVRVEDR